MSTIYNSSCHILMLTHDSQIDRRILLQAESLRRLNGAKVTILAMPAKSDKLLTIEPEIVRLNLQQKNVGRTYDRLIYFCDTLLKKIVGKGSHIRVFLRSLFWQFQSSPEVFYKKLFLTDAMKIKADIYVAHDLPLLPIAAACAKQYGAKLVYDSHELYSEQLFSTHEKKLWHALEAKYIGNCDKVITINSSIADELSKRYQLSSVEVILNAEASGNEAVNNEINLKDILGLKHDDFIVLYQGSMTEQHNLNILIDAMTLLKPNYPNIHLLFLGDGSYVKALKKYIDKKSMMHQIHYHPAVPQQELGRYTRAADVGIIPYLATCLNNYLCTPNKLFEYIAAGIPIVANDLPELRKFIADNGIGLVGNAESAQAIANMLTTMLDMQQYQQFKHRAMVLSERINWETEAVKLKHIYQDLLSLRA